MEQQLELDTLRFLKILGKGATGTVLLVHDRSRDPSACCPFALKLIRKLSPHSAERRARWELSVLNRLTNPTRSHPFLPILLGSIETTEHLGWATPFCPGGDLNSLRFNYPDHCFSPAVMKFFLAEIVCALDHLHSMRIVYRDLKPENVLIQETGHVTLTDFDLSRQLPEPTTAVEVMQAHNAHTQRRRKWSHVVRNRMPSRVSPVSRRRSSISGGERCDSFVGTEEYVSPEMVRGGGHGFAVDWWALGVLAYEMLYGTTPFKGKNKKETFHNILMRQPICLGKPWALTDFIQRLLEKVPAKRLGYINGAEDIKRHEFFHGVQWDLLTKVSRPPFLPSHEGKNLNEKVKGNGIDVGEYLRGLTSPEPILSLHIQSPLVEDDCHNLSLTEF